MGVEIAKLLGYIDTNAAIRKKVKDKYKCSFINFYKNDRPDKIPGLEIQLNTTFINEFGAYQLIMSSKMEKAELFKDWVYEEVLPSIRKTGEYKLQKELDNRDKQFQEQQKTLTLEYEQKLNEQFNNQLILEWTQFPKGIVKLTKYKVFCVI